MPASAAVDSLSVMSARVCSIGAVHGVGHSLTRRAGRFVESSGHCARRRCPADDARGPRCTGKRPSAARRRRRPRARPACGRASARCCRARTYTTSSATFIVSQPVANGYWWITRHQHQGGGQQHRVDQVRRVLEPGRRARAATRASIRQPRRTNRLTDSEREPDVRVAQRAGSTRPSAGLARRCVGPGRCRRHAAPRRPTAASPQRRRSRAGTTARQPAPCTISLSTRLAAPSCSATKQASVTRSMLQGPPGMPHRHARDHRHQHAAEETHAERVDRRAAERPFAGQDEARRRGPVCSSTATGNQAKPA